MAWCSHGERRAWSVRGSVAPVPATPAGRRASVAGLDRCSAKNFSDVRRLREAKPPEIPWHGQAPVHEGLAQM